MASVVIGLWLVRDVADTLGRAQSMHLAASRLRAELVGDAVATQHVAGAIPSGQMVEMGGLKVRIDERDGDCLVAATEVDGREHRFTCSRLPGAAPAAFGVGLTVVDRDLQAKLGGASVVERGQLPQLVMSELEPAVRADLIADFRRDQSVALMHLEAGTEGDDYVWNTVAGKSGLVVPGNLLVVPGHLWIERGAEPLDVELRHDLVIVVRGNLYLGRPLQVHGGGRLVLVTSVPPGSVAFADRDGNGRWSPPDAMCEPGAFHGPAEGGGAVFLGYGRHVPRLVLDAGLVVAGELHVATDCAVRGPLVLPFGITWVGGNVRQLEVGGGFTFQVERERVPGFATNGAPRPSLLRCPDAAEKLPDEPLYLLAPPR